jgi:hypothetical protein
MPRHSIQEIEQYYFNQFKAHYPIPPGQVEHTDKPDVIVRSHRTIGIEIARLYLADGANSGSEQRQRRIRDEVLRKAQVEYLATGGKKIELTFSFDPSHPISNRMALSISTALAKVAAAIEKLPAGQIDRSHFRHVPEVCFIYHNPIEYHDAKWRTSQVYTVPNLSLSRLAEIAESKHRKLAQYTPCDAYWLLLVVDFMDPAQDQEIHWPESEAPIKSPFEKIIVYKPQFAAWIEVPIES